MQISFFLGASVVFYCAIHPLKSIPLPWPCGLGFYCAVGVVLPSLVFYSQDLTILQQHRLWRDVFHEWNGRFNELFAFGTHAHQQHIAKPRRQRHRHVLSFRSGAHMFRDVRQFVIHHMFKPGNINTTCCNIRSYKVPFSSPALNDFKAFWRAFDSCCQHSCSQFSYWECVPLCHSRVWYDRKPIRNLPCFEASEKHWRLFLGYIVHGQ